MVACFAGNVGMRRCLVTGGFARERLGIGKEGRLGGWMDEWMGRGCIQFHVGWSSEVSMQGRGWRGSAVKLMLRCWWG